MTRSINRILLTALVAVASLPAMAHASALDGTVVVENGRHLPLNVRIDGSTPRFVAPGDRGVFRDVPNGVRVVEIASAGVAPQIERVQVNPGDKSVIRVAALTGSARFRNVGGTPLRVAVDGQFIGTLAPGETAASGPLLAGAHIVAVRDAGFVGHHGPISAVSQDSFEVSPGRETRVQVGRQSATLEVHNPFPRRVAVMVDGRRVGALRGRESMTLSAQTPGAHRVALVGHGKLLAESTVMLRPGSFEHWRPAIALTGSLRLVNTTHRALKIRVDGAHLGKLDPGATRVLHEVAAGTHEVELRGGGVKLRRSVEVRPHAEAVVATGGPTHGPVVVTQAGPRPRPRR